MVGDGTPPFGLGGTNSPLLPDCGRLIGGVMVLLRLLNDEWRFYMSPPATSLR